MRDAAATGGNGVLLATGDGARKARLLFVLPVVPWPIRRNGYSLRFAPVVAHLAQRYELDIVVLAEGDESAPPGRWLDECHALTLIDVPGTSVPRWLRRIKVLCYGLSPWGPSVGSVRYASSRLERALLGYLQQRDYAVVVWAACHLEVACRIRRQLPQTRFVIDVVDSPTLLALRNASTDLRLRTLTRYSGWKLRRLEKRVQQSFDATIYISSVDAQVVRAAAARRVHVVPNGVFHADAPPLAGAERPGRVVGFLGNMSYPPNVSAALRLAQRIFPRIKAVLTDATLLIIGRNPAPEIIRLAGPAISVTGAVENIWPQIVRANLFVFPMFEGSGLQNKILEAMYAGIPVVTTHIAAAGMGASSGEQLLVADGDEEVANQAVRLLCDPAFSAALAARARTFVLREFSWPTILPQYEAIVVPAAATELVRLGAAVRPAVSSERGAPRWFKGRAALSRGQRRAPSSSDAVE
jgi:glycosyltransferase involved in cell wall biosynthesis